MSKSIFSSSTNAKNTIFSKIVRLGVSPITTGKNEGFYKLVATAPSSEKPDFSGNQKSIVAIHFYYLPVSKQGKVSIHAPA